MLTWRLWRRLRQPEKNPFYLRLVATRRRSRRAAPLTSCASIFALFIGAAVILYLLPLFPVAIMTVPTLYGVLLINNVSTLGRQRVTRQMLDAISLTTIGPLRTSWAVCQDDLQRRDLMLFMLFARWILIALALLVGIGLTVVTLTAVPTSPMAPPFSVIAFGYLAALILYFDPMQTLVGAALVGVYALHRYPNETEARAAGIGLFVGVQLGVYLAAMAVWVVLINGLRIFGTSYSLAYALAPTAALLLLIGLREFLLHRLWRQVIHLVAVNDAEVAAFLKST